MKTLLLIILVTLAGGYFLIEMSKFFVKLFNLLIRILVPFLVIIIFFAIWLPLQGETNDKVLNPSKRENLVLEKPKLETEKLVERVNISPQDYNTQNHDVYIVYVPNSMNEEQAIAYVKTIVAK